MSARLVRQNRGLRKNNLVTHTIASHFSDVTHFVTLSFRIFNFNQPPQDLT